MSNQITALVMVLAGRCLKGIGPIGEPSESLLSRWVLTEKRFQMNSYYCAVPKAAFQATITRSRSVLRPGALRDKAATPEQQRESSRLRLSCEQAGLVRPIREKSATEPTEEQPPSITALLDWFRPHTAAKSALKWVDEFVPQFYDSRPTRESAGKKAPRPSRSRPV